MKNLYRKIKKCSRYDNGYCIDMHYKKISIPCDVEKFNKQCLFFEEEQLKKHSKNKLNIIRK